MLLVFAVPGEGGTPVSIVNSKHNLSSSGTGSIKALDEGSGGTSEICVFCHTPHTARLEAPLWNRTNPEGPYTVYYSDVMSALSITPESPVQAGGGYAVHVKTRICMSCHDGTIALGQLVNMPTGMSGSVAMQGTTGGLMPDTAAGYIGTDLRDDHPVAVKHRDPAAVNPEMKSLSGSQVRLYYDSGGGVIRSNQNDGGWIECTSCHDAHDNQYGNFLVDDNVGSKICLSCHEKTGYTSILANESVHSNTNYSNAYPTATGGTPATLGSSVQDVKCMVCHFPHKSGVTSAAPTTPNPTAGKYLLTYQEEQSCYNPTNRWNQANSSCHDTGGAGKNISAEVNKGSAHHVEASTGAHNATEGRSGSQTSMTWHVECVDCHNSHTAGKLLHTNGTNAVTSVNSLYGAGGVAPSWPAAWNAPNTFTYKEPIGLTTNPTGTIVTNEYEICLRCHSAFSSIPATMTDQAKEFNINNSSYHSVVQVNAGGATPRFTPTLWTAGSGFSDDSTMYCADCHGNDNLIGPQGTHGSSNANLTVLPWAVRATYDPGGGGAAQQQQNGDLCFKCHETSNYNNAVDGTTTTNSGFRTAADLNLHNQHAFRSSPSTTIVNPRAYRCVNCHIRNSHGWKRKALVVFRDDGSAEPGWTNAYEADGAGSGLIDNTSVLPAAGAYGDNRNANCTTSAVTGCHN